MYSNTGVWLPWNNGEVYRSSVDFAPLSGLPVVHYLRFSTKEAEVPFFVFRELFHLLVRKCNQETRQKLTFPKGLLLIDSTTMTVGKTRLPWAPDHGERAGIKLHDALRAENGQPLQVVGSPGSKMTAP
jgi:hypothetical protein